MYAQTRARLSTGTKSGIYANWLGSIIDENQFEKKQSSATFPAKLVKCRGSKSRKGRERLSRDPTTVKLSG